MIYTVLQNFEVEFFLPYIITSQFLFAQFVWIISFGHTDSPTKHSARGFDQLPTFQG